MQPGQTPSPVSINAYDGTNFWPVMVDSSGYLLVKNYVWNPSTLAWEAMIGNASGGGGITVQENVTSKYSIAQIDSVNPYYGFVAPNGYWYIMYNNSGSFGYASGSSNFATNWTNRAGLSYGSINNVL
jgi:hypothetical protein